MSAAFSEMTLGQLVSLRLRTNDARPVLSDGPCALHAAQARALARRLSERR